MVTCMSAVERPMHVALAQPDRVFGYEPKGRGFESLMPRHEKSTCVSKCFFQRNSPLVSEMHFAREEANFISHCSAGAIFHNSRSELFHILPQGKIFH